MMGVGVGVDDLRGVLAAVAGDAISTPTRECINLTPTPPQHSHPCGVLICFDDCPSPHHDSEVVDAGCWLLSMCRARSIGSGQHEF